MKKIIALFVVVLSSFCLIGSVSAQIIHRQKSKTEKSSTTQSSQKSSSLKTLFKDNLGNYPSDFKMLENKAVRNRLIKVLGEKQFNYLVRELSDVQTPIEFKEFCYYTWMMKAHSGGEFAAHIGYDPKLDAFAVTIINDGNAKSYGEKGFLLSERMFLFD